MCSNQNVFKFASSEVAEVAVTDLACSSLCKQDTRKSDKYIPIKPIFPTPQLTQVYFVAS